MARRDLLSGGLSFSLGNLVPKAQTCQTGAFAFYLFLPCLKGCPGELDRSPPQVSGVEAEPSPGLEEKQLWEQRLEYLQQAVARLEIDRSRLQRHNVQLRTTLEQVSSFCCPWLPPLGSDGHATPLPMQPPEQGW